MSKIMLIKKDEISVTEEKKGKQIAVKENNITSLKEFYKNNMIAKQAPQPQETLVMEEIPTPPTASPAPAFNAENMIATPNPSAPADNTIVEQPVELMATQPQNSQEMMEANSVIMNQPIIDVEPSMQNDNLIPEQNIISPAIEPIPESNDTTSSDAPVINLVPTTEEIGKDEEMDPELQEIKERLDKVIMDLNNYKKKIKLLEEEVNQNLEKSREVLKDTQAAAKIMSIQQERQRQINEEINGGTPLNNDPTRILQKDT